MKLMYGHYLSVILVSFFVSHVYAGESKCQSWFANGKVSPQDKDCVLKCSILMVDMGTFGCPTECEKLCKDPCKEAENFWKNKLKNGRPDSWPNLTEKSKLWTDKEKATVLKSLTKMPHVLKFDSIQIYRMEKSKDYPNPSSYGNHFIALYDSAFDAGKNLERILFHELAHELFENLSEDAKDAYYESAAWIVKPKEFAFTARDDSTFVQPDGKETPYEDFANNLEYYLFDPIRLKKLWEPAFKWIKTSYGGNLELVCK